MSKGTIDIKYTEGGQTLTRHTALITDRALYHKELMAEEYVLLSFNTRTLINFKKGDWIETEFGRFEIVTINRPSRNTTGDGGWFYEQKFHASWERWKNRKLFYDRQHGSEKAWNMTNLPEHFMQIVCDNIKGAGFGDYTFDVDGTFTEMKNLQFDGDDIVGGLNKIAEAWETEWWLEGNHIHLSKCEFGTPIVFEEGDICSTMNRSEGQRNDYVTRLYAFGSDRNIPTNYRKSEDSSSIIEAVVERRLKLPEGTPYIDAWTGMREDDVVEGIVIFDGVYPKRIGNIDSIETHTYTDEVTDDEHPDGELVDWTAYRFKDNGITFKSEYILPDTELHIIFQTGALAGMDFAVTFNPDGENENDPKAQVWEIVRNDNYGVDLPSETFRPQVGDTYVLYGYDTSMVQDILIPAAEQELLIEAQKYIAEKSIDDGVYSCPTNPVRCAGYVMEQGKLTHRSAEEIDLEIGQAVELRSDNYFPENNGKRMSRIRMFEKRLDNKFNATYEVGESSRYSKSKELNDKVESIVAGNITVTASKGNGGSDIYLIKRYDGTAPTDYNAYSAKRSDLEFLHRTKPDEAEGLIKFLAGARFGTFSSGITGTGGSIDDKGNGELESLTLRRFLEVPELRYNRISIEIGNSWRAPGGGIILSCEPDLDSEGKPLPTGIITLHLEEGEIGTIAEDDICMGIYHNEINSADNSTENTDDSRGNFQFAGFYSCYFRITEIIKTDDNSQFRYTLRPLSDTWSLQFHPTEGMHFVGYGNFSNKDRQTARYSTRTYERYLKDVADWEFTENNIAAQFGDLSNLGVFGLIMTGYSAYLNNIYFTGNFSQVAVYPLRIEIDSEGDNFLAYGETKHITCAVFRGWEEITDLVTEWKITRDSGDPVNDAAWQLKQKVKDFAGEIDIAFTQEDNDLSTNDRVISTLFTIKATIDENNEAEAQIII